MKFSNSVLFTVMASSAMASTDASVSYTPPSSTVVSVPSSSSSAVIDLNDPVQKSALSLISKFLTGAGIVSTVGGAIAGLNGSGSDSGSSNKIKRDFESFVSASYAPTATNSQSSSSATSSLKIDMNDPVQKNVISDIGNFFKSVATAIILKRDEASAPSADEFAQLVANLASAISSASSASAVPTATPTNVKRNVETSASYTPSATISSYPAYASFSSSAVVDPNDPVQKSIFSILGKIAKGFLSIFGIGASNNNNKNNKMKRDLESLITVPTGTSTSESLVSVDLSDPVQKAIWGKIGKTIVGTISKRDYDELSDAQRKGLGTWLIHAFGIHSPNPEEGPVIAHKREVTKEHLDQLVADLAAAASSAASVSAVSATAVSTLL
ncbi:unnamed protein product [Ambrosiozyma monospora]|uniref:Unnamed protein product n=1 Tax=Ambrosiozyma monospora TaxID=43982 RepID=A0ACB5ST55_AMBMO|nr:unnamed protein product [Ambrosiozyma monospora]